MIRHGTFGKALEDGGPGTQLSLLGSNKADCDTDSRFHEPWVRCHRISPHRIRVMTPIQGEHGYQGVQ